jgi:hypothetical protein
MHTPVETPVPDLDLPDVQVWRGYGAEMERRLGAVCARSETRPRAMAYLAGLLSPAEGHKSWQLPDIRGDHNP